MDEPWFTYFRGRGKMQITPRNGRGWTALVVYILMLMAPAPLLPVLLRRSELMIVPYLALVTVLTIGFIRFAIARSERVDLDMSAGELEEFRAWKRRGKR